MTATSVTDICNRALVAVAARATITDIELENSPEARLLRTLFAPTRDAVFRAANWNFCAKTAYLTLLRAAPGTPENPTASATVWDPDTMPPPPWLYQYEYPSDCVRMRSIPTGGFATNTAPQIFPYGGYAPGYAAYASSAKFEIRASSVSNGAHTDEVNSICTNVQQAIALYTKRVENPSLWDPSFQEALVYALASRICVQVTGSADMLNAVKSAAVGLIATARANDGNEGLTKLAHTPDWIRARGPGAYPAEAPFVLPWLDPFFLI